MGAADRVGWGGDVFKTPCLGMTALLGSAAPSPTPLEKCSTSQYPLDFLLPNFWLRVAEDDSVGRGRKLLELSDKEMVGGFAAIKMSRGAGQKQEELKREKSIKSG